MLIIQYAIFIVQRVAQLPHDAQPVRGVARKNVGIDGECRFELRQHQRRAQRREVESGRDLQEGRQAYR